MISFAPSIEMLAKRLRRPLPDIRDAAVERWAIAPPTKTHIKGSIFLPGQLERIRKTEFGKLPDVIDALRGDRESLQGATEGLRLRNVDLVDGVLYGRNSARHIHQRRRRRPAYMRTGEATSGAFYATSVGTRWFANWLGDDCLTYFLAEQYGPPIATSLRPAGRHIGEYETILDMKPRRLARAHFDELIIFEDRAGNQGKTERAHAFRDKLIRGRKVERHPGVFLIRGLSGDRRILENERELAEDLAVRRGFKIMDPSEFSVDEIVMACAGAAVVAGVEGSQVQHGIMAMPEGSTLFVVQPPLRTTAVFKIFTDQAKQRFSFVVAEGGETEFRVDIGEVHRTLDLCEAQLAQCPTP